MGNASKKDPVMVLLPAYSPAKRPTSLTSSLEVIASGGEEVKKKKKVDDQSFLPTFWDDAKVAALKAHEALSVHNLGPLMAKSSSEVMSSHIQKLVQVLGESLFVSRRLLDLEKKVATFEPLVMSLSAENETLKNKVAILTIEVENDKECAAVLEKSLQIIEAMVVKDFKDSDEYSNELYRYYVEGFDLLWKCIAKHHVDLDLSSLVMNDVEKELLVNRPSEVTAGDRPQFE
nr:hypothetical protein CFP56_39292 [Quercus suber]